MARIRCAHCKGTHESVAEVKSCAGFPVKAPATPEITANRQREEMLATSHPATDADWAEIDRTWKSEKNTAAQQEAEQERIAYERKEQARSGQGQQAPGAGHKFGWDEVNRLRRLVPAGRFAVYIDGTVMFYKVDKPTDGRWKGYTFVKVQASDEYYPLKGRDKLLEVLGAIAVDPKAAMLEYGRRLEHCGHCGRTLTNDHTPGPDGLTSLQRGIGPVCASNMGW